MIRMRHTLPIHNRRGTSLLELLIALSMSTIVIAGVYQVYNFVTVSTLREKQKAELQRDIITVSSQIERDIRSAGSYLPGNGVTAILENEGNDRLSMYINETRRETVLSAIAQPVSWYIRVPDTVGYGFTVGGSVCIAATGIDTIYRRITRIGMCSSGPDTLHLSMWLISGPFPAGSRVFPAIRIRYQITPTPTPKLSRVRNLDTINIGGLLDSLNVIPKNVAGNPVGNNIDQAALVTVLVGGHVGKDGNRVFIGDSTEVNIRNNN